MDMTSKISGNWTRSIRSMRIGRQHEFLKGIRRDVEHAPLHVIYVVSQASILKFGRGVDQRMPVLMDGFQYDLVVVLQRVRGVFQRIPVPLDGLQNYLAVVL